jgi:outer membrane protein assembly factor BamA
MLRKIVLLLLFTLSLFAAEDIKDQNISKTYELQITGVEHLDKADIAKSLGVKENSLFNFWSSEKDLPQEFVENLDTTLKGYLESKGYFDAKFTIHRTDDRIIIDIKEGQPVRVTKIVIESDIDISKFISWKEGDIFAAERFENIKDKIATKLLQDGYCKADLSTKAYVDLLKHSAKLEYRIKKGVVCHFEKPTIEHKPDDITEDVILSRVKYHEGERFDIRKIEESYNSLNSLGVFGNIQIKDNVLENRNSVETKIFLDKKEKLRRYMISLGYATDLGMRAKGSWEKRDFLGNAKKIKFVTELSKKYQTFDATLFVPAFFTMDSIYSDLYVVFGALKEVKSAYKERKLFLKSYIETHYSDFSLKKGIGLELLNIDLYEDEESKIGGRFNILFPYFELNYDNRDSKIDPKNGFYANLYGEFGVANRADAVSYLKYLLELRAIKSYDDLTLSAVAKMGVIHELTGHLPASKLFYGGGLFSNRAYSKDRIGYITSATTFSALGGKTFLNLQLEANYKLYKKLYGALFFDTTFNSKKEYNFNGSRINTVGFGLRYKTPIGPVKVDVGFNTHKRKDYAISIMLGQSF